MKKFLFLLCILPLFSCEETVEVLPRASFAADSIPFNIIPQPQEMAAWNAFWKPDGVIKVFSDDQHGLALLTDRFDHLDMSWEASAAADADIHIGVVEGASNDEAYTLKVNDDGVRIEASSNKGLFYGTLTFLQMLPVQKDEPAHFYHCEISDNPSYAWRGMHLDVCRHFYPKEFVMKYIDMMAHYKMNTFHWHLTEDQGWRIEIKKYPKLTSIGSIREETIVAKNFDPFVGDGVPYGGFYTQEDIKEIVAYAETRYVTIVPEIEMPGHSLAALSAYPQFACTEGPFKAGTKWGVFDDIYCAGNDSTFAFLENVLDEVCELFPGKYIHIGGDEAPKSEWEKCAKCQNRIATEGLHDEHELQSYFIRRIEKYLLSKNKALIGWDEILEGGLAPQATVMSWRGEEGGIAAASEGHDVVMTPGFAMYFDHYQGDPTQEPLAIGGFTSLEQVYAYNPMPAELSPDKAKHILGAQCNVWTEYMETSEHVEYMAYPRLLALSEVVWSDSSKKDFGDFLTRLDAHYPQLDWMNVNYRIPEPFGLEEDTLWTTGTIDMPFAHYSGASVTYTVDGSEPTTGSADVQGAQAIEIAVGDTIVLKSRLFTG